jgi:hypothetical protein
LSLAKGDQERQILFVINENCLIRTFVKIDDCCKQKTQRGRIRGLYDSELVTIFVFYKRLGYKTFLEYYIREAATLRRFFPRMPHYKGGMKLKKRTNLLLMHTLSEIASVTKTRSRNFYIDSTPLPTCKLIRARSHTTSRSLASYGHSSTGLFYGVKLHLVVDAHKQLTAFSVSTGKTHDIRYLDPLTSGLTGRIAGDRGYISADAKMSLEKRDLRLISRTPKNMPQQAMPKHDKVFLRKRPKIENVFRKFKHFLANGLSFARSINGFFNEILSSLAATFLKISLPI